MLFLVAYNQVESWIPRVMAHNFLDKRPLMFKIVEKDIYDSGQLDILSLNNLEIDLG